MNNGKYKDKKLVQAILNSIKIGTPKRYAAMASGLSEAQFYVWVEKYPEFAEAVKSAEAEAVQMHVARVTKAAEKQWQASAWMLERRFRDDFALRQEITGKDGEPIGLGNVTKEDLQDALKEVRGEVKRASTPTRRPSADQPARGKRS